MNKAEFNEWWAGYRAAFPEVVDYFSKTSDGGQATLQIWFQVLSDAELADCKQVTLMMAKGEIPPPNNFNRGETASLVRRQALELAYARKRQAEPADWKVAENRTERAGQVGPHAGFTRSMLDDMRAVIGMKKAGAKKHEIEAFLKGRYHEDENDRRERYSCLRCRSTGMVSVWSERAMIAVLQGTIEDRANRTTCAIPCDCPVGERKISVDPKRPGAFRRRFDPFYDVPCIDPNSMDCINDLEKFVEERKDNRPRNYEQSFDNYADGL